MIDHLLGRRPVVVAEDGGRNAGRDDGVESDDVGFELEAPQLVGDVLHPEIVSGPDRGLEVVGGHPHRCEVSLVVDPPDRLVALVDGSTAVQEFGQGANPDVVGPTPTLGFGVDGDPFGADRLADGLGMGNEEHATDVEGHRIDRVRCQHAVEYARRDRSVG